VGYASSCYLVAILLLSSRYIGGLLKDFLGHEWGEGGRWRREREGGIFTRRSLALAQCLAATLRVKHAIGVTEDSLYGALTQGLRAFREDN